MILEDYTKLTDRQRFNRIEHLETLVWQYSQSLGDLKTLGIAKDVAKKLILDLAVATTNPPALKYPVSGPTTDETIQAVFVFDTIRKHVYPRQMTEDEFNEILKELSA